MTLWKVTCMEHRFPGMWHRWYKHQCVAVELTPGLGYRLNKDSTKPYEPGWRRARGGIKKMQVGDWVVVALQGNRVGRLGQVTGKAIEDHDWNPLVQRSRDYPDGEMGRRIFVRWDMTVGPDSRELVVKLPETARLTPRRGPWNGSRSPFDQLYEAGKC